MDCGPLSAPEHGDLALLDGRTTFGARARVTCDGEHALLGDGLRTCGDGAQWTGEQPSCLCEYRQCARHATSVDFEHSSTSVHLRDLKCLKENEKQVAVIDYTLHFLRNFIFFSVCCMKFQSCKPKFVPTIKRVLMSGVSARSRGVC